MCFGSYCTVRYFNIYEKVVSKRHDVTYIYQTYKCILLFFFFSLLKNDKTISQ